MLSQETETELSSLFNILLPESAIQLDNYLDVDLLLLACYQGFQAHLAKNVARKDWNKRDAFCVRVLGLILTFLAPETAMIFCESLSEIVRAEKKSEALQFSANAQLHILNTGESFYRASRGSYEGQGFDFLCGMYGEVRKLQGAAWHLQPLKNWQAHLQQKQKAWQILCERENILCQKQTGG